MRCVINFEMPQDLTTYVHRVGRTARAGRGGRAVTLTGEKRRLLVKQAVRRSHQNCKSRIVPEGVVGQWRARLERMDADVAAILQEEKAERELRKTNNLASKAAREMQGKGSRRGGAKEMGYGGSLTNQPRRTWFQTKAEKDAARAAAVTEKAEAVESFAVSEKKRIGTWVAPEKKNKRPHRMTRKKRRRMEGDAAMIREAEAHAKEHGALPGWDPRAAAHKQSAAVRQTKKKAKKEVQAFGGRDEDLGGGSHKPRGRGRAGDYDGGDFSRGGGDGARAKKKRRKRDARAKSAFAVDMDTLGAGGGHAGRRAEWTGSAVGYGKGNKANKKGSKEWTDSIKIGKKKKRTSKKYKRRK